MIKKLPALIATHYQAGPLTCLVLEPVHEVLELLLVQGERRDLLHRLDKPRLQGLEGAHVQLTGGERKIWKQMNLFIYTCSSNNNVALIRTCSGNYRLLDVFNFIVMGHINEGVGARRGGVCLLVTLDIFEGVPGR